MMTQHDSLEKFLRGFAWFAIAYGIWGFIYPMIFDGPFGEPHIPRIIGAVGQIILGLLILRRRYFHLALACYVLSMVMQVWMVHIWFSEIGILHWIRTGLTAAVGVAFFVWAIRSTKVQAYFSKNP